MEIMLDNGPKGGIVSSIYHSTWLPNFATLYTLWPAPPPPCETLIQSQGSPHRENPRFISPFEVPHGQLLSLAMLFTLVILSKFFHSKHIGTGSMTLLHGGWHRLNDLFITKVWCLLHHNMLGFQRLVTEESIEIMECPKIHMNLHDTYMWNSIHCCSL